MDLYAIKRKTKNLQKGSIFPLVSQLEAEEGPQNPISSRFCIFEGKIRDHQVIVTDINHMKDIYSAGFFGKGDCSYGQPKFDPAVHEQVMHLLHFPWHGLPFDHPIDIETLIPEERAYLEEGEQLALAPVEAYFLAFGLGILKVKTPDGKPLNLDELYAYFLSLDSEFPILYVAYHHFRQKGWVVRSGMTMAADYILYKDGPPYTHASFVVIVRSESDSDSDAEQPMRPGRSERAMDRHARLCGIVHKTLLQCTVLRPSGLKLTDPECLKLMSVVEDISSRWEPSSK